MDTCEYHEPSTVDEACAMLAEFDEDGLALAGGTAFTLLWQLGFVRRPHAVGLRALHELRGIQLVDDSLWIGAMTTHREVEHSPLVRSHHGALGDAFASIATVRIRNQATVGGNLAHADPAQDPPPILMALGAVVEIAGVGGRREVPVDDLFTGYMGTTLTSDELIVGVRVPLPHDDTRATYLKFLPRTADDYATVSVAAALRLDGAGVIAHARVALGAVASVPVRAVEVERALTGQLPTANLFSEAAALVDGAIEPSDDHRGSAGYKREMARVWVERALQRVAA